MEEYTVIGKGVQKVDALDKVTGKATYSLDIKLPHTLWGRVMRSSLSHAKILDINTSKAERISGVKAIITARDVPDAKSGFVLKDGTILARGKVRYIGEPVAAVVAVDRETSDEAIDLIKVDYEELPALFDPEKAMEEGAPLIHEAFESYFSLIPLIRYGNVCYNTKIRRGDVEKGFAQSDHIFEDRFTTQMVHQSYMEPHVALAQVDNSGKVTVWTSTQSPFGVRAELAETLQMPLIKIRVMANYVGGGFGGKFGNILEPYCVLLAKKVGRPVKMIMTRREELTSSNPRHPSIITIKTGVKKDGAILAKEAEVICDTGAFSGMGPVVASIGSKLVMGPYNIPNLKVDGYCVYTNKTSSGFCRGAGNPQVTFSFESQMDIIAHKLRMDPLEFRRKNGVEEGGLSSVGQVLTGVGFKESLEKATMAVNWEEKPGRNRGKGIGCMEYETGGFAGSCCMKLNEDGTVSIITGTLEIGQGGSTVLSQIAAEELGIPLEDIKFVIGDTDLAPYDMGTGADRVTFSMGNVVLQAARELKQKILFIGSMMLEANVEDVEIRNRMVSVKGTPERGIPLFQLSLACHHFKGGPIISQGSFLPEEPPYDQASIEGGIFPSTVAPTFATQVAEVEVDPETGYATVLQIAAAHDCGFAINPMNVEGQIEGGVIMGLGFCLSEEIKFEGGRHLNPRLADYKLPTALDIPKISPLIVEKRASQGPFGAKGVGEPGATPTAPAIANAIFQATGARVKDLPITPERLYWAIKGR